MALKITDLGEHGRAVLTVLAKHASIRSVIAGKTGLAVTQVSKALNRLSAFGLVEHPAGYGEPWSISDSGKKLVGNVQPDVAPEPAETADPPPPDAPEMSAEMSTDDADDADFDPAAWVPEPPVAPPPRAEIDPIAADLMAAMEIEVALDYVRTKLRSVRIPAHTQRVYREILNSLPPALVDALAPVTQIIETHSTLH